ncbi:hypothetical protein N8311_00100 [bacterium]|jgi:hypothetical protein|nr:hypothetical protein [Alphaproteobacteria bacterium]MDB0048761.1 hypothetical protein [Alphaproteobacteria bacterium]MDC1375478.1 hypothetical protein [bacterium]|tara:strand:+ start:1345 stop:1572 length:228 start_codon:yes stop_codon:yes gene_type:complete
MNDDNRKYLWNLIQSTGDFLLDKLPEHPNHPKGRNPYAHVALKVKTKFGLSYKDLPDDKLEEVKRFLNFIKMDEG